MTIKIIALVLSVIALVMNIIYWLDDRNGGDK